MVNKFQLSNLALPIGGNSNSHQSLRLRNNIANIGRTSLSKIMEPDIVEEQEPVLTSDTLSPPEMAVEDVVELGSFERERDGIIYYKAATF